MPAGSHNYFKQTRGNNSAEEQVAKKKGETLTAKPYTLLEEGEEIGYSFLIQPVKTSFKKLSDDLKSFLGVGSEQASKSAEANNKDLTEADKEKLANDVSLKISNQFQAKLISAESIKTGAYICLPLPMQIPRDQLSISYSVEDLGAAVAGYTLGTEAADRIASGRSLSGLAQAGGSYALRSVLQEILPKGVGTAFFGNIPNPFSANIFENVEPRSFTFTWMLQPKSAQESEKIREIINLLRYYSLPEPDGLKLELPHEFNIAFLGTEFLYAFSRCVISNIETNYSPNGFNVFFNNGAPETVELSITFKEIFPLNKEVIMNFGNVSMTPSQTGRFETEQDGSQSDKSVETVKDNSDSATAKQISQYVDDWKAKNTKRLSLIAEREQALKAREVDPNRIANIDAQLTAVKIDMNLIKTEVDTLIVKLSSATSKTGRAIPPLPLV